MIDTYRCKMAAMVVFYNRNRGAQYTCTMVIQEPKVVRNRRGGLVTSGGGRW